MKLFRKTKLNSNGFGHFEAVIAILVIAGIAAVGARVMFGSHAATSNNLNSPIEGIVGDGTNNGYWLYSPDGAVFSEGSAQNYGSLAGKTLSAQIVGMASTYDHQGYYLIGADGAVYAYGDAQYHGGLNGGSKYGKIKFQGTVIGIAAHNGGGYWIMTSTGATYAFGNAPYLGNASGSSGIASINTSPDGKGYFAVSTSGQGYNFDGDTSCGASLGYDYSPVIGAVISGPEKTDSCWMVSAGGYIFDSKTAETSYGQLDLGNNGATSNLSNFTSPVVGIAGTGDGNGYWMAQANGNVYVFGDAVLNETSPVKYTQAGSWTNSGPEGVSETGDGSTGFTTYTCKLHVGPYIYVDGEASPPATVSPASYLAGNYLGTQDLGINLYASQPSNISKQYFDTIMTAEPANVSMFRAPFARTPTINADLSVTIIGGHGGGVNPNSESLISSIANCPQ